MRENVLTQNLFVARYKDVFRMLSFPKSKLNIFYINVFRLWDIHIQGASKWSQALLKGDNVSENGICFTSSVKHVLSNVERLASSICLTVNINLAIWSSALSDGGNDSWSCMFEAPQQAVCSILHNQPMAIRKCGPKSCMNSLKLTTQIYSCRYNKGLFTDFQLTYWELISFQDPCTCM